MTSKRAIRVKPNLTRIKSKSTRDKLKLVPKHDMGEIPTSDYEKLARLKVKSKALEAEIKTLQEGIILGGGLQVVETTLGKLKLNVRELWTTVDKDVVLGEMGFNDFMQQCTISKTGITKVLGEKGFKELVDSGACEVKSVSRFYKLVK